MKRTLALLVALLLLLCACSPQPAEQAGETAPTEEAAQPAAVTAEELALPDPERLLRTEDAVYANAYDAYLGMLEGLYTQGQYYEELGLAPQADFAYTAGAAAAGSLRLCIESILFLKGEGDAPEDVILGRLGDWDSLARLSPASPYPDYFEGLVYQMQGNKAKAKEYYTRTLVNPAWPQDGWDLAYLKQLDVAELYTLRDALLQTENSFYRASPPELIAIQRDVCNFSAAYLIAKAQEALEAEDTALAAAYAEAAVRADPFDGNAFAAAAVTALMMGDSDAAAEHINNGLYIAPEHEGLNTMLNTLAGEDAA